MIIQKLRNSKALKVLVVFVTINMITSIVNPTQLLALTSGPSVPEVQSFEPINTNQMVDLFSGDFTYNIPLFNLPGPNGGYPFNLAYHAGIGMEQEASWVGLGWNINAGALNRNVRDLPDDFNGDKITVKKDMKANITAGLTVKTGIEIAGINTKLGISQTAYYNNYKGWGSCLSPSISYDAGSFDIGLDFQFDSQGGIGVDASLEYSKNSDDLENTWYGNVKGGINSKSGLSDISLGGGMESNEVELKRKWETAEIDSDPITGSTSVEFIEHSENYKEIIGVKSRNGGTSVLSYMNNSFSPSVQHEFRGFNAAFAISWGFGAATIFTHLGLKGFYSGDYLKNRGEDVEIETYGFLYLQNSDEEGQMDMSLEKDGMIHKESPNIPIPSLSNDVYSVVGQGIGNMFRPYRSDFGITSPRALKTDRNGINLGLEFGPGPGTHTGANLGYNYSHTKSGSWDSDKNETKDIIGFNSGNVYFRTYGEHTAEVLLDEYDATVRSEFAVNVDLEEGSFYAIRGSVKALKKLSFNHENEGAEISKANRSTKKPANVNILPIFNYDLGITSPTYEEVIREFDLQCYNVTTPTDLGYDKKSLLDYSRLSSKPHHIAGFSTLNSSGVRYIYGLPLVNKTKKDVNFSIDGTTSPNAQAPFPGNTISTGILQYNFPKTDKYYSETNIPEYAYSYLLTSVLGPDYVDLDDIPGPSDGDLGYWVKFNYVKTNSNYKWKAPYQGISVSKGKRSSAMDDKGGYLYGEKETWHLATAETKSHIAQFIISKREDGRGANEEFHDYTENVTSANTSYSYKLDKIKLFIKNELYKTDGSFQNDPIPLQTFHFKYADEDGNEYGLCQSVSNHAVVDDLGKPVPKKNSGKLRLKEYYITYKDNDRGASSPYVFDYDECEVSCRSNPDYEPNSVNRWGGYKPIPDGQSIDYNNENPYIDQLSDKADIDAYASVWNLKSIKLPSGGTIEVEYESDDYAYVQDKVAMQMTKMLGLKTLGESSIENASHEATDRRIYFELEHPIAVSSTELQKEAEKYILRGDDLYFKILIDLSNSDQSARNEYVCGYATVSCVGIDEDHLDATSSFYVNGYVEIDRIQVGKKHPRFHPFSIAGWQHMRTNQPELIGTAPTGDTDSEEVTKSEKTTFVRSLVKMFDDVALVFNDFHDYMYEKGYANSIDLSNSFIRLRTPDKIKYGGGCRVRSITFNDNWATTTSEEDSKYGHVYDYTTVENGELISSGVATYEPIFGGDEIPLRKPKKYTERIPILTDNNLYFEEPINENLFPSPSVGYSKVTVRSLATYNAALSNGDNNKINTNSTTGQIVNEFYTAKDFPVRVHETELVRNNRKISKLYIPIPLIGSISEKKMTVSQGYSIVLNDMHGKPKKVTSFGQDITGNMLTETNEEVNSVEYIYNVIKEYGGDGSKDMLNNEVMVLEYDNPYIEDGVKKTQMDMGTEIEFMIDMREKTSFSMSAGIDLNIETFPTFFIICPWPSYSHTHKSIRLASTNKIIHQSGILSKITTYDGQTSRTTENLYYDQYTGKPLLTKTTNDFDQPIYNYEMLAHREYEGMGPAYKNLGSGFEADLTIHPTNNNMYTVPATALLESILVQGDELVCNPDISGSSYLDRYKLTYIGLSSNGTTMEFYADIPIPISASPPTNSTFKIVRSGRRNLINAISCNILALSDPTTDRKEVGNGDLLPYYTIDNVINIAAVSYSDSWLKDLKNIAKGSHVNDNNPYSSGERGIWNVKDSYAYIDDRGQTNNIDIENDGTLDDVPLFQWFISDFLTHSDNRSNWIKTNQITKIGINSYEHENKNAANIFSSALYDHQGELCVAVAANAGVYEVGTESFETYVVNGVSNIDVSDYPNGNIDIYNTLSSFSVDDVYNVTGSSDIATTDRKIWGVTSPVLVKYSGEAHNVITAMTMTQKHENINGILNTSSIGSNSITLSSPPKYSNGDIVGIWEGEISVPRPAVIASSNNNKDNIYIVDTKAHTGEKSLCIEASKIAFFNQNHLRLEPGEKYILSMWVSSENEGVPKFSTDDLSLIINYLDASGNCISPSSQISNDFNKNIKGQLIEGWQKFYIEFTPPTNTSIIQLEFESGSETMYVDDLRIFPFKAEMQTYVYDNSYRLHATLDNNNYATFYYYNEDGSIFLVKRETEKGIMTIQESRAHTSISN